MKLKKGYVLHSSGGENLMLATGNAIKDFNGLVRSNETAQFLLEQLQKDVTEQQLVKALLDAYEVDEKTAAADVHRFLEKFKAEGFLDD